MERFFFTYGSSEQFPFQHGWTEVVAPDYRAAVAVFRHFHPDITPGLVNCSDIYPEKHFDFELHSKYGSCHEVINLTLMRWLAQEAHQ